MDVAGTVAKIGRGDCRLKVGDRVWADLGGVKGDTGGMADYAVVRCAQAGIAPRAINLTAAGTIPLAGLTSVEALEAMGAPWPQPNLTMVVTSGTGGTGYIGVQLAKAVSHCVWRRKGHLKANDSLLWDACRWEQLVLSQPQVAPRISLWLSRSGPTW